MRVSLFTSITAISVSALGVVGAVTIMIVQGSPESTAVAGEMSTGVTVTQGAATIDRASTVISVSRAAPTITGPAPLPQEQQGLPG